jgi:hypothetical protein
MSQDAATTMQHVSTGATLGGGSLSLLATYSNEITVAAIVIGAIATVVFGVWSNLTQRQRNRINKRNITADIISSYIKSGEFTEKEINKIKSQSGVD